MTWPLGYDRIVLDQTDSTNKEAARRAPDLAGPTWILAIKQTAAKGRRERPWSMAAGNFAATLVMRPTEPPEIVALRSFVAALALNDALVATTGRPEAFALKWPNDVLLHGGKLAGILLESVGQARHLETLAIGIGVNLASAPSAAEVEPNATPPVSVASELGVTITPQEFLEYLASAYANWEQQFATFGFAPIRQAWLARATRLGQQITARTGAEDIIGTFETVDSSGALVLTTPKGRRAIAAAEIFF